VASRLKQHSLKPKQILIFAVISLLLAYLSTCLFLLLRQRHLIYRPAAELSLQPNDPDFDLPYEDVWMPVPNSQARLHGWWIPAPTQQEDFAVLPNEPKNILKSTKVVLYLCGVGRNMGDYNYLARVSAFRQLGFSVLVFDYRGYGLSEGDFPNELQLYQDSQAAWNYLRDVRQIPPDQIIVYGESLGGAIALDLALRQPEAGGLVLQSSFTSMSEAIRHRNFFRILPVNLLLTERFDSLSKVRSLRVPVLFLHGSADSVVPSEMSRQLYEAASEPKQMFVIPEADHVRIYQPGDHSYLKAIQRFMGTLNNRFA
jgi:alpha-beta hydrolase superfamily lysophospholipase